MHTKSPVVHGQSPQFCLDIVGFELGLDRHLNGLRCIFTIAGRIHCLQHILNRFFDGSCVLVEQLKRRHFMSVATNIGKGIFNMDL